MEIRFGALAPKLSEQLKGHPVSLSIGLQHCQQDADAVRRLAIRGLIGDSVKRAIERRIVREIERLAKQAVSDDYA